MGDAARWWSGSPLRQPCGSRTPPLWCIAPAAPAAGGGLRRFHAARPWTGSVRRACGAVRGGPAWGAATVPALRRPATRHGPPTGPWVRPGAWRRWGCPGRRLCRHAGRVACGPLAPLPNPSGRPWCKRGRRRPSPAPRVWHRGREPWGAAPGPCLAPHRRGGNPGPGPRRRRMDGRMTRVPCPRDWPPQAPVSGRMQVTRIEARWTGGRGRRRAAPRSATAGRVAPSLASGSRHPDPPCRTPVPRGAEPTLR
jgi:hypothetical protein